LGNSALGRIMVRIGAAAGWVIPFPAFWVSWAWWFWATLLLVHTRGKLGAVSVTGERWGCGYVGRFVCGRWWKILAFVVRAADSGSLDSA
jgi:hypothetical protein